MPRHDHLVQLSTSDLEVLHAQRLALDVVFDRIIGTKIGESDIVRESELKRIAHEAGLLATRIRYRIRESRQRNQG